MIQLWVNLPAKDKMATPGYQSITAVELFVQDPGARRHPLHVAWANYPATAGGVTMFYLELKMIQLWVNLPAKDKMATPGYQSITAGTIPTVALSAVLQPSGWRSVRSRP
jgi:redox-sensitive bicupin YhaK (pirin superfamily)